MQGGITNGETIYFRVAFKPTATIMREQDTVSVAQARTRPSPGRGRHDPCVLPRAVPDGRGDGRAGARRPRAAPGGDRPTALTDFREDHLRRAEPVGRFADEAYLSIVSNLTGRLLVGRYRLGRIVDEAALCSTYEAHDVDTREDVSVELITRPNGAGLPSARRLRREARRIVDTTHVGLRAARTIGVEGGVPFIVAEPVRGESLSHRLTRRGPLPIADCLAVALQIIDALATAHAGGIVHGNLAPEKIRLVVEPAGATLAKVMGLGVTTLLGTMRDVDTRGLGTPAYLAPEQLTGPGAPGSAGAADELTDVWSVGLVLFEMLTGRRAFDGATAEELGRQIRPGGS